MSIKISNNLLIVIALIMVVIMIYTQSRPGRSKNQWDCVDKSTGETATIRTEVRAPAPPPVIPAPDARTAEAMAVYDNIEYFNGESAGVPFSDEGSYVDWIAAKNVDQQAFSNHAAFVNDMLSDPTRLPSGRTYTPDSHTADQTAFQGLRRPESVPFSGDNAQVPDVDFSWFTDGSSISWKS